MGTTKSVNDDDFSLLTRRSMIEQKEKETNEMDEEARIARDRPIGQNIPSHTVLGNRLRKSSGGASRKKRMPSRKKRMPSRKKRMPSRKKRMPSRRNRK